MGYNEIGNGEKESIKLKKTQQSNVISSQKIIALVENRDLNAKNMKGIRF